MRRGRKTAAVLSATLVTLALAGGAAYGVLTLTDSGPRIGSSTAARPPAASSSPPSASPSTPATVEPPTDSPAVAATTEAPAATASPSKAATPKPEPKPLLAPGDTGRQVRELQGRLAQLAWFTPPMTGRYDDATRAAVDGFQAKRGFEATGAVDQKTWQRLVAMSRTPTDDELFNRAGPALFGPGSTGPQVRVVQARLRQIAWFSGDVTDSYGDQTASAVSGFQTKRGIPATGKVDQRTLDLLESMTREPTRDELANKRPDPADGAALDPRCSTGHVLCIDKTSSSLRWVVNGKPTMSLDVRFGAEYSPTREGVFHVGWKDRDHVSQMYGSAMPFSMFFSGGQAVHYSSDFAARGYAGASHGCVNVRDYDALADLFDKVDVGDKVVVYRS